MPRMLLCAALALSACGKAGVTDTPRPSSISLAPENATVRAGSTLPLSVALRDANGNTMTASSVFWSSSDNTVASVSTAGIVSAHAAGTVTIAATSRGLSATASITVENPTVATVQVSPAAASVLVGSTTPLVVRTLDAEGRELTGRAVAWTTNNPAAATVNASGVVLGVGAGTATITATSEGRVGAAVVTVNAVPVATVTLSPALDTLQVGETAQLSAQARDAGGNVLAGRSFVFSSADIRIATVSSTGLVTAIAPGTTTVQGTSEGRAGTATVVIRDRPVAAVTLTPASSSVIVGGTVQLTARTTDAAGNVLLGRSVAYSSSNNALATVNSAGLVSALLPGTVSITATSEGKTATANVRVDPVPVAVVQVAPSNPVVSVGSTVQLTATARSASGTVLTGRPVTWRSGTPAVATVSTAGLVTALAPGIVVVSAEVDGVTGSATVTVRVPDVATVSVTPATASLAPRESTQLVASLRDALGNTLTGRNITWSSSDESVAFVTSSGSVLAFKTGTAIITATSEGVSGTARITVR